MVLLALGLATARPDVAALGLPMALGVAWGWFSRPRGHVRAAIRPGPPTGSEGAGKHSEAGQHRGASEDREGRRRDVRQDRGTRQDRRDRQDRRARRHRRAEQDRSAQRAGSAQQDRSAQQDSGAVQDNDPEVGRIRATFRLEAPAGTSVTRLRVATTGYRTAQAVVAVDRDREIGLSLGTARTGVLEAFRVDHIPCSHDEVLAAHCPPVGPIRLLVRPRARPLRRLPLPYRLQGLVGPHTSRRVGDGMELHDIHEFTPGDRLRRIDWRTTVRRSLDPRTGTLGELYVRRTLASADATVMLVVDSRDDVGPDVDTWAGGTPARMTHSTSVDLAREAATSVAQHFLDRGDRVGLDDLGRRRRPVAPAAGGKHAERISQRLARIAPEGSPQPRLRSPRLPSGALAIIFSTFLDDEAGTIATLWRSQGHRVLAVDVLPKVNTANLDSYTATSYQLIRLERGLRLADLRRQDIDVIHWAGDPDGHGTDFGPLEAFMLASTPRRGRR